MRELPIKISFIKGIKSRAIFDHTGKTRILPRLY
jgi:hypothetical protein